LDLSIDPSTVALTKAEASAKLEALRWPAAWHRFTLACHVAKLYVACHVAKLYVASVLASSCRTVKSNRRVAEDRPHIARSGFNSKFRRRMTLNLNFSRKTGSADEIDQHRSPTTALVPVPFTQPLISIS
jgi:hypothetical protein